MNYNKTAAGKRISSQRKRLGLTRGQMADSIGKTEKYYSDIERGYCGMSLDTMIEIAGCLGITLDYMIFGENDGQELPEDSKSILFYLEQCDEKKRRKAMELLRVYLSE